MAKKPARARVVLITGASRGLGLGIARKLAAAGYCVIAVARKPSKELTAAMAQAKRGKGGAARCTLSPSISARPVKFRIWCASCARNSVRSIGLVNNAAIGLDGVLATMHNSQIEELIRVNTLSPIVLSKYVVRSMMSERAGRIVNVASIVGFTGYSGLSVYAATKASMLGFTRSLAREVGRLGITVNAVAPGFLDTEMTHGLADEQRQQVMRRSALRRLASVDDVAGAVEYLLSDSARSMSGTVLTVDAGATA